MTQSTLPKLPPIHGYWDVKPSNKGDKTQRKLLYEMGAALVVWERLESRLAELFTIFLACPTDAAARAYGTIITNRGRCEMLVAASEIYFATIKADKETRDVFGLLIRHCGQHASPIRNQIAHGITIRVDATQRPIRKDGRFGKLRRKTHGFFLMPPAYSTNKRPAYVDLKDWGDDFAFLRVKYRYTSADLLAFGLKFEMLADAAKHFCQYLDPHNLFQRPNG